MQLEEGDLKKIEDEARKIAKEGLAPERIEYKSEKEARQAFKNNPFKLEILRGREETLSAYRQGEFTDLCTGPHLAKF